MNNSSMAGARSELLVVVALALFDEAGRVLMQRRPEGRQHGGLWEFPGGKVEAGEGPTTALVREIAEELGLALSQSDLFPIGFASNDGDRTASRPLVLLLFGCRDWRGTAVALEPGSSIAWVATEALGTLAMPPLDVPLAAIVTAMTK